MPSTGAKAGILPYSVTMAQTGDVKLEGPVIQTPMSLEAQSAR
jgi:hypothetical protein